MTKGNKMTAKEFINKKHPTMVDNWSNQAALLSYGQVAQLMDDFHEEDYTQIRKDKPRVEKYLCIKDYHPLITTEKGKRSTAKAVVKKGIILTFTSEINAYRCFNQFLDCHDALYEYTLKNYKDCFKPLKNEREVNE